MKNIDFLPSRYHEQTARRKAHLWQGLVLALFGTLILAAAGGQCWVQMSVKAELADVAEPYRAAEKRDAELTADEEELTRLSDQAALYAYLRHPWPRTQLLAAVYEPLPEAVALTELTIRQESRPRAKTGPHVALEEPEQDDDTTVACLKKLKKRTHDHLLVIELNGMAAKPASVHDYVSKLETSPLIGKVSLESLQAQRSESRGDVSNFMIRAVVAPSYGDVDGPSVQPAPGSTAASQSNDRRSAMTRSRLPWR